MWICLIDVYLVSYLIIDSRMLSGTTVTFQHKFSAQVLIAVKEHVRNRSIPEEGFHPYSDLCLYQSLRDR